MTVHPHETDRILGVLGDAIHKLRSNMADAETDGEAAQWAEVANDLALLHGAVSAERDSDEALHGLFRAKVRETLLYGSGSVKTQEDTTKRAFLRLVKGEEISDEAMRGEHRDD